MTKEYVVGFVLSEDRRHVVLVRKNRPKWQEGRLNGVGGKVEPSDVQQADSHILSGASAYAHHAMAREYYEEVGTWIGWAAWDHMCTITWPSDDPAESRSGKADRVHFFRYVAPVDAEGLRMTSRSMTDEAVEVWGLQAAADSPLIIPNLRWLLPLAAYTADTYEPFQVNATVAEVIGAG